MNTTTERHLRLTEVSKKFNPAYGYSDEQNAKFTEVIRSISSWYSHQRYITEQKGKKTKAKRKDVIQKQERILEAVLSNFVVSRGNPLSIPLSKRYLSKRDRYRPQWFTHRDWTAVLEIVTSPEIDLISLVKGHNRQISFDESRNLPSIIQLTERGKSVVRAMERDYVYIDAIETIRLKTSRQNGTKALANYQDDELTTRMRSEMTIINRYLKSIIIYDGEIGDYLPNSELYRVFNDDFRTQGRLYGGSWYNLGQEQRLDLSLGKKDLDYIEPVTELDFKACGLSIISNLNHQPLDPKLDPYQKGELGKYPREAIKKLINAMFNTDSIKRWPKGIRDHFKKRPPAVSVVIEDVLIEYPYLKDLKLNTVIYDSEIVVKAMLKAIIGGLLVLPLHDGFYVVESDVDAFCLIIDEVTKEVTGYPMTYSLESLWSQDAYRLSS